MSTSVSESPFRQLNIICFDVPFPADYGGAIEEFYKLESLHQLGIKIHLHCFVYGDRNQQNELEKYCEQVYYYPRARSVREMFSSIPFIVKTRMPEVLLENLLKNDFPILFDATHTTGFLHHPSLKGRKKLVRLHNIEWIYYRVLFDAAVTLKEKIFYFSEYKKLREYDKVLEHADALSCLSQTDMEYYQEKFPGNKVQLDYVFHENEKVSARPGKGNYILYHGNLSLIDNYQLIIDLLANELKACAHPIIIAGKNPDKTLMDFVKGKSHIRLVANPSGDELNELIENAHICLAIAKNASGVKLKLINSLFKARFVIANEAALNGSGLDELCVLPAEGTFQSVVDELMQRTFDETMIGNRSAVLLNKYDNLRNAQQIINAIFDVEKNVVKTNMSSI